MVQSKPPLAGAAPQTRAGKAISAGLGSAAIAALAAALATSAIKPDEGKQNRDYLDIAKVPTACYGHTGSDVGPVGTMRSDAQCDALLAKDVAAEQAAVGQCVPGLRSRPYQWAASTRLAHNIGVHAFCHSGAATHFNRGDWRGGCDLFLPWDKARVNGQLVTVRGLSLRRQRERAQCLTQLSSRPS